MKSLEARKKAFSTYSFHVIVVLMYYGPFIFTYMRPESYHTPGQDKFLAIFYTIVTPTLNPVIYSFQNKDILMAMKK
ncbi:Olfactory receptor 2AJ1 [Sciurus carolinensis]|uniref:Olfactory receptor 2AJ1 n=1 Tax=Sciurus carolinensis TaxID=30640 RepID=A0AA41NK35_SCICA|nr:Olfactory receptor 2AJ1 [Sciurus carolinensis]